MFRRNDFLRPGEKVFVIERRLFRDDLRRHFIGEVVACNLAGFRAKGYPFYYHSAVQNFVRKPKPRTRLFSFHGNLIINILPENSDVESVNYIASEQSLTLTDEKNFKLDISDPDHLSQ